MALKKRESLLFQRMRKNIKKAHFTRIESSTVQGIPDVHGCIDSKSFWIEMKSTEDKFPVLSKFQMAWCYEYQRHGGNVFVLHSALSHRALKLYKVSGEVDPSSPSSFSRSLVLVYTSPDPVPSLAWRQLRMQLVRNSSWQRNLVWYTWKVCKDYSRVKLWPPSMERVQRGETSVVLIYHLSPPAGPCWPVAFTKSSFLILVSSFPFLVLVPASLACQRLHLTDSRLAWNL